MKLDLGAGAISPEGFTPLGNINGTAIFPLPHGDGTVEMIRASHVLEHFPSKQVSSVLADWARALKPGGELHIAVPDFKTISERYLAGQPQITEGYVMGGQVDEADFHKAIFDEAHLRKLMAQAGLMLIRPWKSELPDDCAALPISLNLSGTKPHRNEIGVSAVMGVPRLGFMDNFFCCFEALPPLKVNLRRHTGAFWPQNIERVIGEALEKDSPDAILTLDYDSVFSKRDASMLMQLMCCHPEADAIAAMQSGRGKKQPLFTIKAEDGQNRRIIEAEVLEADLTKVSTAHFGLTLLRAEKFKALPKPWFRDVPDADGGWGDGRRDADIAFWDKWLAVGNTLYQANRVPIGHAELMVLWPGADLQVIHQSMADYHDNGAPEAAWK